MVNIRQRSQISTRVSLEVSVWYLSAYIIGWAIANVVYIEAKERSKELLDISKNKLDDVDDELRRTFQAMEEVRHWIFCIPKAHVLNDRYGQSGKAHERSADQLRDELETLRQKLELVLGTEPGVIEQYERRKEEVRSVVPLFSASNTRFLRTNLLCHR
jgi:hypothetical protein